MSSFKTKKIKKSKSSFQNTQEHEIQREYLHKNTEEIHPQLPQKSEKIRRKKSPTRFIASILLILSSLLFVAVAGAKYLGNIQVGGNLQESAIFKKLTQQNPDPESHIKKQTQNILIAGIGGKWHPGGELTDSLMLASLNFEEKTVTMLSIPRDWYVATGKHSAGKINTLYPLGQARDEGVNMLAKKVSEITGQPIHHYIIIDFSGFKSIVDALGGVTVDVPKTIYDHEYPDENYGYEVFTLQKWLQTLDGKTALKFARSRHSTSDFDRSSRQQLLLKSIKDKALSLGILTNPKKIGDLISSVQENLSTDLTVGDLVNIGVEFRDMDNSHILMYSYNNECGDPCQAGGFLYQPQMSLFGNAWVLIPNGASKSRLSKYDDTQRFADLIFSHPTLKNETEVPVYIVSTKSQQTAARNLRNNLELYGFPIDRKHVMIQTGATLNETKILVNTSGTGSQKIDKNHTLIQALKKVEPSVQIIYQKKNSFSKKSEPAIEIVLGVDQKKYFQFDTKAKNIQENEEFSSHSYEKNSDQENEKNEDKKAEKKSIEISKKTEIIEKNTKINTSKNSQKTQIERGTKEEIFSLPSDEFSDSTPHPGEWENF